MTADTRKSQDMPPEAPFHRPMPVSQLPRDHETKFRVVAEADELSALASYLDVDRIDRLTFAGFISPEADDVWRIRGHLVARIEQACVVTLAPLSFRHDAQIERVYVPADQVIDGSEIRVLHDEADLPDSYEDSLDPAQLAVESLSLMIDPYPRAEGAELLETPSSRNDNSDADRPFAALAALKAGEGDEGA
ncbi:MAG: DUF177 domain-containing protein [Paracoccaceae bacterium]|nr:DUF177 domain-containing protein [Paracoccaceae bacterium]